MNNNLNSELFDYKNFAHREFIDRFEYPWEAIKNLEKYLLEQKDEKIIGDGTVIDKSAKIEGRVIIGKNCIIRDNVLIRGGCIIGDNVIIGHAVEIKNSILLNDSSAGHLNYIGDSIIGNEVKIGGGAITANFRFDQQSIIVKFNDDKFNTDMIKLGSMVGDGSRIGANAVLNPGTILGKNTLVYPLVSVHGTYPEQSVIKG